MSINKIDYKEEEVNQTFEDTDNEWDDWNNLKEE